MSRFTQDIQKFNAMYKLPVSPVPTLDIGMNVSQRLKNFKSILLKEIDEVDLIVAKLEAPASPEASLEILTDLADWLGDVQVYAASEMVKFGLPLDDVLAIIMQSNFSKLGADGKPIHDEQGKVKKGPGYWKPEPMLSEHLAALIVLGKQS
jgi:predicted HAD superfamily Cof-like phosphohydrolase